MMKIVAFLSVAIAFLPTVVADPVILNITMRCDFPEIRHWCAEVLVWEEDHLKDDALEYTWQCTSSRTMKFLMRFKPEGDGDNFYEINHMVYTNCSPRYMEKREKRCICHDNYYAKQVPIEGTSYIDKEYNFFTQQGKNMTDDEQCQIPGAFKVGGRHLVGTNFVDSPCNIAFLIKDSE